MLRQMTVEYKDDNREISVTISQATTLMGVQRSILALNGFKKNEELAKTKEDARTDALAVIQAITYPDLVACVVGAQGLPVQPTIDEFLELPDEFVSKWEQAVYDMNPHWIPSSGNKENEEKKAEK